MGSKFKDKVENLDDEIEGLPVWYKKKSEILEWKNKYLNVPYDNDLLESFVEGLTNFKRIVHGASYSDIKSEFLVRGRHNNIKGLHEEIEQYGDDIPFIQNKITSDNELKTYRKIRKELSTHWRGKHGHSKQFCFCMMDENGNIPVTTISCTQRIAKRIFKRRSSLNEALVEIEYIYERHGRNEIIAFTYGNLAQIANVSVQSLHNWRKKEFPLVRRIILEKYGNVKNDWSAKD